MIELGIFILVFCILFVLLVIAIFMLWEAIGDIIYHTTSGKLEVFLMSLRNIIFGVLFGFPLTLILIGLIFGV